jgi:hypothetical protein
MSRHIIAAITITATLLAACGTGASRAPTATPAASATPGGVMTAISGTAIAVTPGGVPPSSATPAPAVSATPAPPTSTPPPEGATGIAGMVTIGPTCPVERPESPCADRPYQARLTFSRLSDGSPVASVESAADGRFFAALPPGSYRVVGESAGPMPHAVEQTAEVVQGRVTSIQVKYDSGIR